MLVLGTILASLVLASLADEETLNGADSNTITVLDPRKLTRSSSNINAAAINSLTGSGTVPSADGKSNETTLIFATHVTEPAPQLETHSELNNQLGQTVYLQAQPQPQHNHHDHQQSPHHGGQFLYPQPAPVQSGNLGSHGSTLNAPGGLLLNFNDIQPDCNISSFQHRLHICCTQDMECNMFNTCHDQLLCPTIHPHRRFMDNNILRSTPTCPSFLQYHTTIPISTTPTLLEFPRALNSFCLLHRATIPFPL